MLKISLVNMPFAILQFPSIALSQLKSVAESRFGDRVRVRILYLNHDFAHYLGIEAYQLLNSVQASNAGLGDWMFRTLAFPDQPDNADAYFKRYYPQSNPAMEAKLRMLRDKRAGLARFLESLAGEDVVGFTMMFAQNVASFAMRAAAFMRSSRTGRPGPGGRFRSKSWCSRPRTHSACLIPISISPEVPGTPRSRRGSSSRSSSLRCGRNATCCWSTSGAPAPPEVSCARRCRAGRAFRDSWTTSCPPTK